LRIVPLLLCLFAAGVSQAGRVLPTKAPASPDPEALTHIDRRPGGVTVLPNGRRLTPPGRQVTVAPHPYGLALSRDGGTLVASSNGTGPFELSILDHLAEETPHRSTISVASDPELRSLYRGVVLSPDGRTLYASGGNDGRIHLFELPSRRRLATVSLDDARFAGSIPGDLALSPDGRTLLAVDQGNYRLVVIDASTRRVIGWARTGRIPFAVAFTADGRSACVANAGLFEYRPVERRAGDDARGLAFPPFGYPSREAREGTVVEGRRVPGLGSPHTPEAYSVWGFDLADPAHPGGAFRTSTGIPISTTDEEEGEGEEEGEEVEGTIGGSVPCALATGGGRIYVSNANNDSVQILDAGTGAIRATIRFDTLLPRSLRGLRGLAPYGLAVSPDGSRLYVALSGFNAVAIVDARRLTPLGMIPTGWYPARVAVAPDGRSLYIASAKGHGSGPNAGPDFVRDARGTGIGGLMSGLISLMATPGDDELPRLTAQVLRNNGVPPHSGAMPQPPVHYVVVIVKENRTCDEVFGALPGVRGQPTLARFGTPRVIPELGGEPVVVMPNHVALARRFAVSDNYYVDSDHSADGHRWLAAVAPNHWTESVVSAGYGGQMSDDSFSTAPGRRPLFGANSAVVPEDYPEAGTLWHHLARHRVSFHNWGEGFEFAGDAEDPGEKPTGARLPLNIPMPMPLFRRTSRDYPEYNTNIPDQYRADVFRRDLARFEAGKQPMPRFLYVYLPNDHGAAARPKDGYPVGASFQADNDAALGRVVEALSRSRFWKRMAIFVTEDDAQGGVDSVDAHRSVLMVISPWVRRGFVSRRHSDMSAIHHTVFRLLRLPPLSLWDALAPELSDFWTRRPDFTPYDRVGIDPRLFDPAKAKDPKDPEYRAARRHPSGPIDDPELVEQLRRREGLE
jgi:YVTN family beta-propeller protein